MATDPSQLLVGLLNAPGLIGQQTQENMANQQQIAASQQQMQLVQAKLAAAQQDQQTQNQFQQDVASHQGAWTPQDIFNLSVKYPDQARQFSEAAKAKDDAQRQSDLGFFGGVYSAAKNNKPDLAIKQLQARSAAEHAAGMDTSDIDGIVQDLQAGEPEALQELQNFSLAQIYAHDPDQFAKVFNLTGEKTHVINPGGALVDDTGKELYHSAPAESNAIEVPVFNDTGQRIGTRLIPNGGKGGDPASEARSFGWTPRGPNSDAAVDGKNNGMAQALGIGVDDPFPQNMSNAQIAQALSLSEGGAGSLADRNNNPANLTDAKTGAYRKFPNKAAGLAAAAAQVARNRARGQNSIRSMVEGLPSGGASQDAGYIGPQGGASASTPGNTTLSGDAYLATLPRGLAAQVKALSEGRLQVPTGAALRSPQVQTLWAAAAQYDPDLDQANAKTRYATRKEFTSGKAAANITSFNTVLHHIDTLSHAADDLHNRSLPIWNTIANSADQATGGPAVAKFNSAKQAVVDELERSFRGTSGTLAGIKGWEEAINSSSSPAQIKGVLTQMADLLAGRIQALGEQYTSGMGKSVDGINLLDSKARMTLRRFGSGYGDAKSVSGQTGFTHMSASGAYGYSPDRGWVKVK